MQRSINALVIFILCACFFLRRELIWPELDQLLRNEDDVSGASAMYTAAIPEYRVVFYDHEDSRIQEKKNANGYANGHASYDIQHPCLYVSVIL